MRAPWVMAVLLLVGIASNAAAHGPTVRVAYGRVAPATLSIRVGDTVHFTNGNASGAVCTVVLDDGSTVSPPITRSEGWHHRFLKAGRFTFHLKEMSSAKGVVVVLEE